MKVTDIFESGEQYHISLANKIPKGIKSTQELFDVGYSIAVKDLGLTEAKSLDSKFAINLINAYSNQQLDEGIGSAIGKAAGWTAGAVGAAGRKIGQAWDDAKAGYAAGKARWNPTAAPGAPAAPATGGPAPTAPAPAAPTAPSSAPAGPAPTAPATGGPAPTAPAPAAPTAPAPAGPAPTAPAPQVSPYKQVQSLITKLDKKGKQRILALLQKQLGIAPAAPTSPAPTAPAPAAPTAPAPATGGPTPTPEGLVYSRFLKMPL